MASIYLFVCGGSQIYCFWKSARSEIEKVRKTSKNWKACFKKLLQNSFLNALVSCKAIFCWSRLGINDWLSVDKYILLECFFRIYYKLMGDNWDIAQSINCTIAVDRYFSLRIILGSIMTLKKIDLIFKY